jgi:alpha-beta hydrolase superfamily lysophospholipase
MDAATMTGRVIMCLWVLFVAQDVSAASEKVSMSIRGQTQTLAFYRPAAGVPVKGTILMGSGDVGWVGLAVDLAGFLAEQGYAVIGINARLYLASYTSRGKHVLPAEVTADYASIVQFMRDRHTLWEPIVVAGVSEGAALAVLAGARVNHSWVRGVMTMGLPASAELAWRWKDALAWITKQDSAEPSFEPALFISEVAPVPLWMIQSTKDEYVTRSDFLMLEAAARAPKRLVLVDASNHRFTDRLPLLREHVLAGLAWMQSLP